MLLNIEKPEVKGKMMMGQPFFSNELDVLFFVAVNWPGGYGGDDICYSKYDRATDTWGKPQNMGPKINTKHKELYPAIHPDGTFYFTSDGHKGYGGWDIFSAKMTGETSWGKAENMGEPINSEADDFGIIFKGNTNAGYFSSTRKGGFGKDDIYEFFYDNITVSWLST